jgi:hypothetical protein
VLDGDTEHLAGLNAKHERTIEHQSIRLHLWLLPPPSQHH